MTTILKDAARSIAIDRAGGTGVTFKREDGPTNSVTIRFGAPGGSGTREAAIALIQALSDQYGLGFEPPHETFKEQFDRLEVGDFFTTTGDDDPESSRHLKVTEHHYYNYHVGKLLVASEVDYFPNGKITKEEHK